MFNIVGATEHSPIEVDLTIILISVEQNASVFLLIFIPVVDTFDQVLGIFEIKYDISRVNGFLIVDFYVLLPSSLLIVVHTFLFLAELQDLLSFDLCIEKCSWQSKDTNFR